MKYIRTKDGVHEIYDTHNGALNHWGYKVNEHVTFLLDPKDIRNRKTADTIEELCDCFAVEDCLDPFGGVPVLIKSFTYAKLKANKAHKLLYGYIIVEKKGAKALEPVAVLNEKGEMELL